MFTIWNFYSEQKVQVNFTLKCGDRTHVAASHGVRFEDNTHNNICGQPHICHRFIIAKHVISSKNLHACGSASHLIPGPTCHVFDLLLQLSTCHLGRHFKRNNITIDLQG